MSRRVYIDFESRSKVDIWESGAYRYAEDPTTEILCLAWAIDDAPVRGVLYGKELRAAIPELNKLIAEGAEFHAHNAFFERCIWRFKLTPAYGALPIPIKQWRCTAAKGASHALPRRLEHMAQALGCPHQKDVDGNKLMKALSFTTGAIEKEKLDRLLLYCKRDVEAERDIDRKLPDLCAAEQRVWFMDQYLNDTGVRIDVDAVKKAIQVIEEETKTLNAELHTRTGGQVDAGTKTQAIQKYLKTKGVDLPNLQKGTVKKAIAEAGGDNLRVLQLRQQLSLTSNAKYSALLAAVSPDERVRDLLVYHGASTGRWAGKLFQIHNLVKALIDAGAINAAIKLLKTSPEGFLVCYEALPTLSSCIRGMFIPSKGHRMFITDFAAIEARVVMWLAGEEGGIKLFQEQDEDPTKPDIYVHMARAIYGDQKIQKKDKRRQLGKQAVLGAGFGMGPTRFEATCQTYGVEVDHALAVRAVESYRRTFARVPRFWYAMEDAAKKAVTSGAVQTCGYLAWYKEGEFLRLRLPSGRTLAYHKPAINAEGSLTFLAVNSKTNKYEVEETWGGKLVENAVQATARDIMVEAMFRLIKKYRILFTVHDELVLETVEGSCSEVLDLVRQRPSWAQKCPINAECEETERYKK